MSAQTHTAVVAVIGRPNAGKSTLINAIVGQKITITSHKPQTTRHRIHAIHTQDNYQFVFIDTPGINQKGNTAFLRELNKTARSVLADVDVVLLLLDGLEWGAQEDAILRYLSGFSQVPCLLLVNKIDRCKQRDRLLQFIEQCQPKYPFVEIVPVSARRKKDIAYLEGILQRYARPGEFMFPEEQVTDRNMRFLVAERIREKILRRFNQEVPYSAAVIIDRYVEEPGLIRINATVHVEQESHKHILVGKGGSGIRELSRQTREELEKETGQKVYLRVWVKLSKAWSSNPKLIREFGYESQ